MKRSPPSSPPPCQSPKAEKRKSEKRERKERKRRDEHDKHHSRRDRRDDYERKRRRQRDSSSPEIIGTGTLADLRIPKKVPKNEPKVPEAIFVPLEPQPKHEPENRMLVSPPSASGDWSFSGNEQPEPSRPPSVLIENYIIKKETGDEWYNQEQSPRSRPASKNSDMDIELPPNKPTDPRLSRYQESQKASGYAARSSSEFMDLRPPPPPPILPPTPETSMNEKSSQSTNELEKESEHERNGSSLSHPFKPKTQNTYSQTGRSLLIPCLASLQKDIEKFKQKKLAEKAAKQATEKEGGKVQTDVASTSTSKDAAIAANNEKPMENGEEQGDDRHFEHGEDDEVLEANCEFSLAAIRRNQERFESRPHRIGQYEWSVVVYEEHVPGQPFQVARMGFRCRPVSTDLCNVWKVEAKTTIGIQEFSGQGRGKLRKMKAVFSADCDTHFFHSKECVKMHVLSHHYADAAQHVHLRLRVVPDREGWQILQDGNNFFSSVSKLCDGVCELKDRNVYINKSILRLHSPFFDQQFKHPDSFTFTNRDIHASDFVKLLRVVYPEQKPITDETLPTILSMAANFNFPSVMVRCEEFMLSDACQTSLLMKLNMATIYELPRVQRACLSGLNCAAQARGLKKDPFYSQLCAKAKDVLCDRIVNLV